MGLTAMRTETQEREYLKTAIEIVEDDDREK